MDRLTGWLRSCLTVAGRDDGQDFAEYALLLALMVVAAAALTPLGGAIRDTFKSVRAQL